jgi:tetratricopeptide (TPR) repeat protein
VDWDAAEARFRRAIELNPRYATAHHWNAWLLAASGRIEESLAAGRAALARDPASVSIRRSLGWLNLMARRWDLSTQHLERAVAMDPTSEENHRILGLALMHQGRLDDAARSLPEAVSLSDRSAYALASLGFFEAKRGQPRVAEALLTELHERLEGRYVSFVAFTSASTTPTRPFDGSKGRARSGGAGWRTSRLILSSTRCATIRGSLS